MFLTLMVIGLVGLLMMALPAFGRHHHAHNARGSAPIVKAVARGHFRTGRMGGGGARGTAGAGRNELLAGDPTSTSLLRYLPSPRAVCSVLALYGAFGNALVHAAHVRFAFAAVLAIAPAFLIEWALVRPVWNLLFRFQATPSSPLEDLILADAVAVVPFRNGRGVVSAVRDGRVVQFAARLREDQVSLAVKVGDRLRIEDVNAERERVTVTVLSGTALPPA